MVDASAIVIRKCSIRVGRVHMLTECTCGENEVGQQGVLFLVPTILQSLEALETKITRLRASLRDHREKDALDGFKVLLPILHAGNVPAHDVEEIDDTLGGRGERVITEFLYRR